MRTQEEIDRENAPYLSENAPSYVLEAAARWVAASRWDARGLAAGTRGAADNHDAKRANFIAALRKWANTLEGR